jgi:hypothetical protein
MITKGCDEYQGYPFSNLSLLKYLLKIELKTVMRLKEIHTRI